MITFRISGARIGTIQVVAFILLALLGVRLYYLQIVKGDYYSERAENQRDSADTDPGTARGDL